MRWRFFAVCAVAVAACPKPLPPPEVKSPPPPPPLHIPPGCEASLDGVWIHATAAGWRYVARDDGGTVDLDVWRLPPESTDAGRPLGAWRIHTDGGRTVPDAGAAVDAGAQDAGAGPLPQAHVVLRRTERGFFGTSRGEAALKDGTVCPLVLPVEVAACGDGGLTLRAPPAATLDARCQEPPSPKSPEWLTHPLVRADAGP